ncbi:MAG: RHS repeat-associated core domain-containing protein, partial [Candidatus Fimenecus sp.]
NVLSITGSLANTLGQDNPFRYRGYYFDSDTGLYYLNSRYYDANTGRFINADSQLNQQSGVLGYNLFAYCGNNPVNCVDPTGHAFMFVTAAIGAVVGAVVGGVIAHKKGKNVWAGIGIGAATGGLIGLGAGAAASVLLTNTATASTAAVLGAASAKFAASGTALGIAASKAIDKVANGYQKLKSVVTGSTDIFRSVSNAELADIKNTGQFNLQVGGMESKQFAFSYAEAMRFGNQPFINQTSIIRASVPNSMINQFCCVEVDTTIFTSGTMTVYSDMMDPFNQAVSGTIQIMP